MILLKSRPTAPFRRATDDFDGACCTLNEDTLLENFRSLRVFEREVPRRRPRIAQANRLSKTNS